MIPITCSNTSSMPNMMMNTMVNMMMPGTHTGFIPLCMGEPMMYSMGGGDPQPPQFELPNCLAVNSCMTHQEHGATKKSISTKGQSGSAMESNAKDRFRLDLNNMNKPHQEMYSSSQSLYSFLHSSDEIEVPDDPQAESSRTGEETEADDRPRSIRQVARPVLSEPFWNEGVVISESLLKTYQMEELDFELVLKNDLEKLEKMEQSELVNSQLMVRTYQINLSSNFSITYLIPGTSGIHGSC